MDETIKLILTVAFPIATVALAAGGIQWQLKNLTVRDEKREKDFETFREADRTRSHELNLKLADALETQAIATSKLVDFEARRGSQIDGNTVRSRTNRARIAHMEKTDAQAAVRRLRTAGVPDEVLGDITDVISRPPEHSDMLRKAGDSSA
jgi:hypothetical protein